VEQLAPIAVALVRVPRPRLVEQLAPIAGALVRVPWPGLVVLAVPIAGELVRVPWPGTTAQVAGGCHDGRGTVPRRLPDPCCA